MALSAFAGSVVCSWTNAARAQESENEEVTVRGRRKAPTSVVEAPTVSATEIHDLGRPGTELPDVLREAPGVQVSQAGGLGSPSTARLRGATAAQTPVFLGEVRLNDEVGGVADLSTVPLHFAEKVQVFRSHVPRHLAHSAIGGAIVIVPKKVREPFTSLEIEAGSFGARSLQGTFGVEKESRSLLVSAEFSAADNDYSFFDTRGTLFVDDDGMKARLPNAQSETRSLWVSSENRLGASDVQFVFHHAERDQGAPKLALIPTKEAQVRFRRSLASVSSRTPSQLGRLRISTRALLGETTIEDPLFELGMLTPRTSTPGEHLQQTFELSQSLSDVFWVSERLTASVERLRRFERVRNRKELSLAARRHRLSGGLAGLARVNEHLSFDALGEALCFGTTSGATEICPEKNLTGRVGARVELGPWEIYANVARAQRLPTLSELFGTSLLVRGNARLRVERATTGEIGSRVVHTPLGRTYQIWADVAGFLRSTTDLVTYVRSAQGYLHPVNRDSARSLGGELSVGASSSLGVEAEGSLALLDARDTSPSRRVRNDILPFLSRATAHLRLSYRHRFRELPVINEATLGVRSYYQSSRFGDPAGLGVIPAQFFSDLEMSARFSSSVLLRGRVSNLFDADRFDVVGFPLPGRSGFFSLEANW